MIFELSCNRQAWRNFLKRRSSLPHSLGESNVMESGNISFTIKLRPKNIVLICNLVGTSSIGIGLHQSVTGGQSISYRLFVVPANCFR